jgi:molecular chaperone Hsp33
MSDEVVMGLLKTRDLRVVAVNATGLSQTAQTVHGMQPAAAVLFAQAVTASSLLTAVLSQKSHARVNFQLECDGPLRGLFVESDAGGGVRGYVKNPLVEHKGIEGVWQWRPVLGNRGYISVLRDLGEGEFFRSSVELSDFDLAQDFERFFAVSEQLEAAVFLEVLPDGGADLGTVMGLLIQPLPTGDRDALATYRRKLRAEGGLRAAIEALGPDPAAGALASMLFAEESFELTARAPLAWRCPCSRERVVSALLTLGEQELLSILAEHGKAEASCHFCNAQYVISGEELCALVDELRAGRGP